LIDAWTARAAALPAVARSLALHRAAMADWIASFKTP
jgi:hypothetical protein